MPSYLDLALLGIVVVSALLSMVRGFTREVLAIASWGAAAAAAYLLYPRVVALPFMVDHIANNTIRTVTAIAIVFFVTLILVSIVTVKLSDAILDSKVGALDRTLGFVFGAARGFLLGVVAFMLFNWLVQPKSQQDWIATARSRPLLLATGEAIKGMLPEDPENTFLKRFKSDKAPAGEDVPADTAPKADAAPTPATAPPAPVRRTDAAPTTPKSAAAAAPQDDKQRLNAILNGATPAKPAAKKP